MKIKIEVDGLTLEHATELTKFLAILNETEKAKKAIERYDKESFLTPVISEGKSIEEKPKLTRKKAEKVEPAPEGTQATFAAIAAAHEQTQEAKEETKAEAIEVVEAETVSVPTLMQIRSLVAQKAGEHKDSIKSKLVELGAQNVSTLDAKHFQAIYDFLNEL